MGWILFLEEIWSRLEDSKKLELGGLKFPFSYRTIDLHSLAFAATGESMSHAQICDFLNMPQEPKPHHALYGAISESGAIATLIGMLYN